MWKESSGLLTLVLGGVLFGQVEVLDLTKRVLPPDRRWGVVEVSHSGAREPVPPLDLSLILPQEVYRFDDEFVFEVAIKNITGVPFPIPWEPDWTKIVPEEKPDRLPEGYRSAALFLSAGPAEQKVNLVAFGLEGSEEVGGSIRVLAPGETVRIRAKGNWSRLTRSVQTDLSPVKVSLWAEWAYFYGMRQTLAATEGVQWKTRACSEPQEVTVEP
jgi:hypothetical protein